MNTTDEYEQFKW